MSPIIGQSNIFKNNFLCWKIFSIWPGRTKSKIYSYFSFIYLLITLYIYVFLLTVNLLSTPLKLKLFVHEVMYFFTEITVVVKVLMVLVMRDEILAILDLLDCKEFNTEDVEGKIVIDRANANYKAYWKFYAITSNVSCLMQILGVVTISLILKQELEFPVCNYYFLSDDIREKYFFIIYLYQAVGLYGHMMYNVNIDSFVDGIIYMGVTQVRVLNIKLNKLKVEQEHSTLNLKEQDRIQMMKLKKCLEHYELILEYCSTVQNIIGACMFVQFGFSSINICVILCALLMEFSTEALVRMGIYLIAMMSEIFIPGWLGTQLNYESQELVNAAYNVEWIPRSEAFKRSLRIFVERANIPIQLTGLKMFRLSIDTFISIMKSAYSFFTLLRFVLDEDVAN